MSTALNELGTGSLGNMNLEGLGIPEYFSEANPFISESISEFAAAKSDEERLDSICQFQKLMGHIRYDEKHIFDRDDTALRPEWMWLSDVVKNIEKKRKELFDSIYSDLAE